MSPRALHVMTDVLAVLGLTGLCVLTASRAAGWLCLCGAFALQIWGGLRSGVISSSLGCGGYWFTHRRDETPVVFMWAFAYVQHDVTRLLVESASSRGQLREKFVMSAGCIVGLTGLGGWFAAIKEK